MDTQTPLAAGTAFGPSSRGAHRCRAAGRPAARRALTAASLALALGVATGGVAIAATPPSLHSSSTALADYWQPSVTTDWAWGTPGYGDQGYGDPTYGYPGYGDQGYGDQDSGTTTQQQPDTADASAAAETGLVEITSSLANGTAAGTGIVLSSDGTVVTNHHVVEGATSIQVRDVSTGQTYTAQYVGGDPVKDVAVLKLADASGLQTASLSTSAAHAGDQVTAVGDANGDGGSLTAAPGTVTALQQSITVQGEDGSGHQLTDLIEVNADIIPGDSGGALLSSDGHVVGMNVAASSGTSDIRGYAIPISSVTSTVRAILAGDDSGPIELGYPGYLGIGLSTDTSGATVAGILDGTAAAGAGLQAGDTITSVDTTSIGSASELHSALAAHKPGDHVRISWTTADGQSTSADVTLGRGPVA